MKIDPAPRTSDQGDQDVPTAKSVGPMMTLMMIGENARHVRKAEGSIL